MKSIPIYHILLFIGLCHPAFSANFYLSSSSGNDSRTFTEAQNPLTPWKSIDKLNAIFSQLQAGDSILFKRGDIFFGSMILNKSGTDTRPIVLSAYGSGIQPTISGFYTISNWSAVENGIYQSDILPTGSRINMVTINETSYPMGRYPNSDTPNQGYLTFESHRNNLIRDTELSSQPSWTNAEIVIRSSRFTIDRIPINDHINNQLYFNSGDLSYPLTNGFGYFIQNDIKTLDQFGEWYYDSSARRIYLYGGSETPLNYIIKVSVLDILVEARGSNIILEDLRFVGANNYAFYNEDAGTKNLFIRNCEINFTGNEAILFSGRTNFQIENSSILNSNNTAINLKFQNPKAKISHNTFQNTGIYPGMLTQNQPYVIIGSSDDFTVEYNTILNSGYIGIRFSGNNVLIKNNLIDTFCTIIDDGGGIYTYLGESPKIFTNQRIVENIVLNGIGAGAGTHFPDHRAAEGIYIDDNSKNIEVSGNTVAHCGDNGILIHNAQNFIVSENTLYNNEIQFATLHDNTSWPVSGGIIKNNIFFAQKNHQITTSLWSLNNNFQDIGSFQNNRYLRPLDNTLTIRTRYRNSNSEDMRQWYDLDNWKSTFNEDQGSRKSIFEPVPYQLDQTIGANKATNGTFNSDIRGVFCWSPSDDCQSSWEFNKDLNGGSMKISGLGSSYVQMGCGNIDHSKQYILNFSTIANREASLEVYIRQWNNPYMNISKTKVVEIGPDRRDHQILFSSLTSEAVAGLEFYSGNENITFWLDNIELYEVEASLTDPESLILFEYNPTQSKKSILLDGRYFDVNNQFRSGNIVLQPYESIILIKDTASITPLPLQLVRFYSKLEDCNIKVEWTTQSETNFSHYELEKSIDGKRFEVIGKLPGIISTGKHTYSLLDKNPKSTNYYRLKMVDVDGSFSYSDILVQASDCNGLNTNWEIYPTLLNSNNSELTSRIFTERDSISLTILDQLGRPVKSIQPYTQKGWNVISWMMDDLSPGIYYIHNAYAPTHKTLKFVVVN